LTAAGGKGDIMPRTYAITGATGNIGRVISEKLLAKGHAVRAIARSEKNLQFLKDKGAELCAGSMEDEDFLTTAYRGADGVFAMIPPHLQSEDYFAFANRIGKNHVKAIQSAGVKHVVALSSIGAHLEKGSGIVESLFHFEQQLKELQVVNVLVLRPSYFMDNIYMQIDIIKNMGIAGSPVAPDISMPVVATQDIADVAARRLSSPAFEGHETEYVLGERNLTYTEITGVLGKALGKDNLRYVPFPYEEAKKGMVQMGLSENIAGLLVELADGINNGRLLDHYVRTPENTTKTTIEEFAESFARLYNQ
jgi:uncharacterized protein YbjT (DUF2867 family)